MAYHVYVTASGEDRIARFSMDPTSGALKPVEAIAVSGRPAPVALDPHRRFMYVGRRNDLEISSYRIDGASGALTHLGTIPVDSDPCYMATDRTGRFLLSAYYLGEKAAVHRIGEDGVVTHPPIEWRDTGRGAHCFQTDASNRFAFVPHIDGNGAPNAIFQFRFDAETGRLTPNDPARVPQEPATGPRHFCFHPNKDILYFSNEQGCSVSAYAFDPEAGTLSRLQTVPTLPEGWSGRNTCAQIHIHPSGRFLYAPNRGHNSFAEFAVDADSGLLRPLGHAAAEPIPRAFAIDPPGRFLLSAGLESGRLAVYRIDELSGRLDRIATHAVGAAPMWVSVIRPTASA
jgi:6-phosphogluconolactonase